MSEENALVPMRRLDKRPKVGRRGVLQGAGLAAIGVTVVPLATLGGSPIAAHAQAFSALDPQTGQTLIRIARDIFPHDRVPDRLYVQCVAPYDVASAREPAVKKLMTEGVAQLDGMAHKAFGKPYGKVDAESQRVELLKQIEKSAFFQRIKGDMVLSFYNNKEVWPLLGYEGSSWEKGGYLNRGLADIDWL
jgi:hypothetical protein